MAKLTVTEFAADSRLGAVIPGMARFPALADAPVAVGATSAQSAAFNANTAYIRIETDVNCALVIGGTNPTATVNNMGLAAGQAEYVLVTPGDKLAVIAT